MNTAADNLLQRHRLNVDEYYRMAEVGLLAPDARVELIQGEVIDMSPIGIRHAYVVTTLTKLFFQSVGERAVVYVQQPLRLGTHSEPQPDLTLLRPPGEKYSKTLPKNDDALLVVEVSDPTLQYDLTVKAPLYARHGIPELWVIDVTTAQLYRLREPNETGYVSTEIVHGGDVEISTLPGVVVDLSVLLKL